MAGHSGPRVRALLCEQAKREHRSHLAARGHCEIPRVTLANTTGRGLGTPRRGPFGPLCRGRQTHHVRPDAPVHGEASEPRGGRTGICRSAHGHRLSLRETRVRGHQQTPRRAAGWCRDGCSFAQSLWARSGRPLRRARCSAVRAWHSKLYSPPTYRSSRRPCRRARSGRWRRRRSAAARRRCAGTPSRSTSSRRPARRPASPPRPSR